MCNKSIRIVLAMALLGAILFAVLAAGPDGAIEALLDGGHNLKSRILAIGASGPLGVILLMTLAVVVSPLPSAPIAVASGAVYGHVWGALYVLIGAQIGAMICFALSRILGYDAIHRWFGEKLHVGVLGSQRALSYSVLISRLLPFVSFDIISYAAGLTVIKFWRFAVATLIGIAPSSFLLAHVGSEAATGEFARIGFTVLLLGFVTAIPLLATAWLKKRKRRNAA